MGLLGSLIKTALDIASIPVSAVKDIATMGGALTDEDKPYTVDKLQDIVKDVDECKDKLIDL